LRGANRGQDGGITHGGVRQLLHKLLHKLCRGIGASGHPNNTDNMG